jgi:hypothetical protein
VKIKDERKRCCEIKIHAIFSMMKELDDEIATRLSKVDKKFEPL